VQVRPRLLSTNREPCVLDVELREGVLVVADELLGVLPALADALTFVAVPGAALFDEIVLDADVDQVGLRRNASPYMMSNSASRNGGASLFFTTLTFVRLPDHDVAILMAAMRRISMRTEL